jgi:hypothetical protein
VEQHLARGDSVIVLPVGHLLGSFFTSETADFPETVDIRVGRELASLPPEAYLVWAAAHGVSAAPVLSLSREDVLTASAAKVESPQRWYAELIAKRLLIELKPTAEAWKRFAREYRVLPLTLGLGNSAENPDHFVVGMVGGATVTLPGSVFTPWMFGFRHPSLWVACENVAKTAEQMTGEPVAVTAVLADVMALIPAMLAVGCACIDRRSDG